MFKKKFFVLLVVLTLLFSFQYVLVGKAAEKKVTIKFMAALYSDATAPFWSELIEAFEKENPDVKVDVDIVNWDSLYLKTTTLISANQEPDILNTDTVLVQYAAKGLLEPLDTYIDESFRSEFIPSLLKSGVYNEKIYALPLLASVRALFYNKNVFEKAGIEPPKTWDELVKDCLVINNPPDFYAFGMPITNFEGYAYISYFLWAAGGRWLDKNGKCVVNSEAGIRALKFAKDLVNKYKVVYPGWSTVNRDDTQKVMISEKIGMMMTANFFPTIAKSENPNLRLGFVPIPKDREQYNLGVVDSLMIFKRSKHKKDAFNFIKFYYGKKWHERFVKAEGMLPVTEDAASDLASDLDLGPFIKLLPHARFYPLHPKWLPMALEVVKAWQLAILGQKSPKKALDEAVAKINMEILEE